MDLIEMPPVGERPVKGPDLPPRAARADGAGADPRLDGVMQELAQTVSRGDVSREQADAFLRRLLARIVVPRTAGP